MSQAKETGFMHAAPQKNLCPETRCLSLHASFLSPPSPCRLPFAVQDAPRINEIIVVGVQDSHTVATDDTLVAPAEIFMGASCGIFNMTDMTPRNYPKKKSDLYKVEY